MIITDTQIAHGWFLTFKVTNLNLNHFIGISEDCHCNTIGGMQLLWNSIFVDVMSTKVNPTFCQPNS